MTSTSRVARPRCTRTLSITTWKNSGLTSAKSCSMKETSSTSPSSLRCLTRLGMNQEKSNLASSPARLARLVMRMSSPLQCRANCSSDSMTGRAPVPGAAGSCSSTRWPSHWASTTVRGVPSSECSIAKAGRGARGSRCGVVREHLALRPRCRAARRMSGVPAVSLGCRPSWWASVAGSAAVWWNLAIRHKAARVWWGLGGGVSGAAGAHVGVSGVLALPSLGISGITVTLYVLLKRVHAMGLRCVIEISFATEGVCQHIFREFQVIDLHGNCSQCLQGARYP